jgi:hypothetical protein
MTTPPSDNNGGDNKKLSETELAIIEMMKKQNLQATTTIRSGEEEQQQQQLQLQLQQQLKLANEDDGPIKHTFWDTQVRRRQ